MGEPFVTIFTSLAVVFLILGILYFAARKVGGKNYGNRQSKYMKIIDRLPISRDKSIEIVEVGDKALIVGITAAGLHILGTVKMDQLRMMEETEKEDLFRTMLSKFINKKDGGNTL